MNRSSFFGLLPLFFLVACGSTDDSHSTGNSSGGSPDGTQQASSCTLAPDEDVCARTDIPAEGRSALANVTAFAGESRRLVTSLEAACRAALVELRQPPLGEMADATPVSRAKTACDAAARALRELRPAGAVFVVEPAACRPATIPACIVDAKPTAWETCDTPKVGVKLSPQNVDDYRIWVGAAEHNLPPAFAAKDALRHLVDRTREIVIAGGEPAALGDCAGATAALVKDATAELSESTRIAVALVSVLSD